MGKKRIIKLYIEILTAADTGLKLQILLKKACDSNNHLEGPDIGSTKS